HPVNIQEYGVAAPDPRDPDLVFGSQRNNVSLYNRKTGQTTHVGPDLSGKLPGGGAMNRDVRTMPINWSPLNPDLLFYVQNVVFKSTDRGHAWTRISPDLARQTWAVPANAGKYASGVTPAPAGTITALSPSPKNINVIWAGTDDGNIQVTMDGGTKWTNVTPAAIKPWTRIFNIEAGHFDDKTAYAAANTMRIDDANPHLWRTHDGGKTWTEIDAGIAAGATTNAIREDPRQKGLLYASTETQVWVSVDDGDHWSSLRLNMPAISVRDLQLKDDSACICSDLIAGTHGRGFWILDDVTPFRQAAAAKAAQSAGTAYLFKPATAVRVRFGANDPTPWPPEVPAGENPPPCGIIDYYLGADASNPVTLEILNAAGKTIRSFSSADAVRNPHPALDPAAYNLVCQKAPGDPYCNLPLYWAAPPIRLSAKRGMHRFLWDLRVAEIRDFDPTADDADEPGSAGAVPNRTYPAVNAPWANPGRYTLRLTVNGTKYTQPLMLRLDPRVKTPAAGLAQLASLSTEMYDAAVAVHAADAQARNASTQLASMSGTEAAALKARIDSVAPPAARGGRGRGGRGGRGGGRGGRGGGANTGPVTLDAASASLLAAAMAMQAAEVTPTASEVAACARARAQAAPVQAKWTALKTAITAFNTKQKSGGRPTVNLPGVEIN
ncbi:MAG: WD40/YVTN/BNR-like repeat-containing protein, partial [Gemmatimonadaceae bacterium]